VTSIPGGHEQDAAKIYAVFDEFAELSLPCRGKLLLNDLLLFTGRMLLDNKLVRLSLDSFVPRDQEITEFRPC
jgi:hypothetical protein